MFLNQKIQASSIAEVVIAIAVIALCFGIASLIFVRSSMVATSFESVRIQTLIQSQLWEEIHGEESTLEIEGLQVLEHSDELEDSVTVSSYILPDGKTIWQQHKLKRE